MRIIHALLSRVSLRLQIGLLASLGMVGLCASTAVNMYADHVMTVQRARADAATGVQEHIMAFDRAWLLAKKAEKNFLAAGKDTEVANHAASVQLALAALTNLEAMLTGHQDSDSVQVAATTAEMRAATEDYAQRFATIVRLCREIGMDDKSGMLTGLRASAEAADAALVKLPDARPYILLLTMRRYERDFLLRGAPVDRVAFEKAYAGLADAFRVAGITADADIDARLAAYRRDFLAMAAAKAELNVKIAEISVLYSGRLEPKLAVWKDQALSRRTDTVTALENARSAMWTLAVAVFGGLLAVLLLLAGLLGVGLTGALRVIVNAMAGLAQGNRDFDVAWMAGRGEIGQMANALAVFKTTAETAERIQAGVEAERIGAERDKFRALEGMAETIEREAATAMQRVAAMAAEIDVASSAMAASAEHTAGSAAEASEATDRAMRTAQSVARAAEELTVSIAEISRQVANATTVSRRAVSAGQDAREVISTLSEQARRIGDVAGLIADIASRTNLLALNATIEAARAGEAGRGFAVVAGEVKNLAGQTARATEEISRQLGAVAAATDGAVRSVTLIGTMIEEMDGISGSIAAAVEQQAAATAEIARNVGETASAVGIVAGRIGDVTGESGATDRHASAVRGAIVHLTGAVRDLKTAVIRSVRTSTAEVDRRAHERIAVELPCRLEQPDGTAVTASLTNISVGGAYLRGLEAVPQGPVRLVLQGRTLAADVVGTDDVGGVNLKFGAGSGEQDAVTALVERISAHLSAHAA